MVSGTSTVTNVVNVAALLAAMVPRRTPVGAVGGDPEPDGQHAAGPERNRDPDGVGAAQHQRDLPELTESGTTMLSMSARRSELRIDAGEGGGVRIDSRPAAGTG